MLTDADRELITAAVGGELSPPEDAAFRRLVAESVDASVLFQQLYRHRQRIQALPRTPAPAAVVTEVTARVRSLGVVVPVPPRHLAPRRGRWVPVAVAASLLLSVSAGAYWFTTRSNAESVARARRDALPNLNDSAAETRATFVPGSRPGATPDTIPSPRPVADQPAVVAVAVPRPPSSEPAPLPRSAAGADVVGSGLVNPDATLTTVHARLPFLAAVSDFERPVVRARLVDEVRHDAAIRVDLFVHDQVRAADVFQAAARAGGISLTVDAATLDRLKHKTPSPWVMHTDALTAEDLAEFLGRLAAAARTGSAMPVFATAHVVAAQSADHKDLRDLLGTDPGPWKSAKVAGPKSVTAGTADEVAAALRAKDPVGSKSALFLTYQLTNGRPVPSAAKDVKSYLDRRGERKPGTVPLLIYIRPAA